MAAAEVGDWCHVLLERLGRPALPRGWYNVTLEDSEEHMQNFPALLEELGSGHVLIIGRQSGDNSSCLVSELLDYGNQETNQVERVTLLQVTPQDLYMAEMVRLLASFQYDPLQLGGLATGLNDPSDRNRWTWFMRVRLDSATVKSLLCPSSPLPYLQLWHFHASREVWQCLTSYLSSSPGTTLSLNNSVVEEEVLDQVSSLVTSQREVFLSQQDRQGGLWDCLARKVRTVQSRLELLTLCMVNCSSKNIQALARLVAGVTQVKLSMVELTRGQWEVLGSEIALPGARIRCLDLEEVVNMVSESTFSFAKTICSVPEVKLSDVRLANDLWEIVAKRLRQKESRLARLQIFDMEFTNTEFLQFAFCVLLIRVVEFREIKLTKVQWGMLGKALAKEGGTLEKLVISSCHGDPVSALGPLSQFSLTKQPGQVTYTRRGVSTT